MTTPAPRTQPPKLSIFKLMELYGHRDGPYDYTEVFVVTAKTESDARAIAAADARLRSSDWLDVTKSSCKKISRGSIYVEPEIISHECPDY